MDPIMRFTVIYFLICGLSMICYLIYHHFDMYRQWRVEKKKRHSKKKYDYQNFRELTYARVYLDDNIAAVPRKLNRGFFTIPNPHYENQVAQFVDHLQKIEQKNF